MRQGEIAQTDTLTDRQVVELVENAIRTRPQDFPLLAKYYLDAEWECRHCVRIGVANSNFQ